ncbi:alpha/beta fold hydrolase [Galactobacter valiniphilus]|uniref:alpha/beta fold hydrolase n=1 Tax=Galactobacter valiniphilus TaxID=2676122 RepID=UPI0037368CCB
MVLLMGVRTGRRIQMPDGVALRADVHSPRRSLGRAPLVLVHGTLVSRRDYRAFAPLLARAWGGEVIVYDRRGRSDVLPQLPEHSLASEAADLLHVVSAVGAGGVLGHSYGGTVTLYAAGQAPDAWPWVTYDAALNPGGVLQEKWKPEFRELIDAGALDDGWALLVQGLGTAGAVSRLPLPLLRVAGHALSSATPVGRRMYAALPGSLREMESILQQTAPFPLPRRGLMLNGGLSPDYFHDASAAVTLSRPGIEHLSLPGLLHNGVMLPLTSLARLVVRGLLRHPADLSFPTPTPAGPRPAEQEPEQ